MKNKKGIVLVGLNGAGKSTFGRYAAQELGWDFFEVEDYWFKTKHDYQNPREAEEASSLLLQDIKKAKKGFIIGGNIASLSKDLLHELSLIVYVKVEKKIRVERVLQRELLIFGDLEARDPLYDERQQFLNFVKNRKDDTLVQWLETTNLPVLAMDGTLPFKENLAILLEEIS